MSPLLKRTPWTTRRARQILQELAEDLLLQYHDAIRWLDHLSVEYTLIESFNAPLQHLAGLSRQARDLCPGAASETLPDLQHSLRSASVLLARQLNELPPEDLEARQILARALNSCTVAEQKLQTLMQRVHPARPDASVTVLVPTDLLFQCRQELFPAERMIVVAGRRETGRVILGAGFDVTGSASTGHVHADPQKLGQALIAMSASNTHLAAWFHSHPGGGLACTTPSSTDLRQHAEWLRNYSPRLLSGIFVQDGALRLWGTALVQGEIEIQFVGDGLTPEGDPHAYRITVS